MKTKDDNLNSENLNLNIFADHKALYFCAVCVLKFCALLSIKLNLDC